MNTFSYIHIAAATLSYLSAFGIFTRKVGSRQHRMVGIVYAVAMLTTALAGFFIYTSGRPSVFHVFSAITLLTIGRAWWAIVKFRQTRDRTYLRHHYFNMAYSFMGLNLAGLGQALRYAPLEGGVNYLTALGVVYLIVITVANRLIQKVFYGRFAPWFGARVQPAE
ncbi:DUF2306 domain-containing protein [Kordiimonas marina]|uniref:DUF2306 domain-containing protein n=1 Tax=Kordiimonas marina TaxID=2872312 RepID=UPI001FF6F4B4|nr:DUF2306 domain-containing protein [Kordiimonas marina]MCJ9429915.1 DUF2306 domain-containing protein [Kordiimonas marina]